MIPPKLKKGDEVRVIAPAQSLKIISPEQRKLIEERYASLGLSVSYGKHAEEMDEFSSTSVKSRVEDIHDAFRDKNVKMLHTVIGGFNCNQLLPYLDYKLIKPKILCGFSDITALQNALFAKTGLVTYSGPHYSTFAEQKGFEYTLDYFKKCLFEDAPFTVSPSDAWTDDEWWIDQENRNFIKNEGIHVFKEGSAEGTIIGANLCTFNLLQGTEYMPSLKDTILFVEDDYESKPHHFDRDLQSVLQLKGAEGIKGIVIGRFQKASEMTTELLAKIIKTKNLKIPVVGGVDFGHTGPRITFPIGGKASLSVEKGRVNLRILEH